MVCSIINILHLEDSKETERKQEISFFLINISFIVSCMLKIFNSMKIQTL